MKAQDLEIIGALFDRVLERVKAAPDLNISAPGDAIAAVIEMIAHEFHAAPQIIATDDE